MTIVRTIRNRVPSAVVSTNNSIEFFGNNGATGTTFIDRVKIDVRSTSVSANFGETDTTLEGWLRTKSGNNGPSVSNGNNYNAINGNIFYDRDRFGTTPGYVLSLCDGRLTLGINFSGGQRTLTTTTDVRDGEAHHWAWCRDLSTGDNALFVDGVEEASVSGPTGSFQYNNIAENAQDGFDVWAAEKHDADIGNFPSFFGWLTEIRKSQVIRYTGNFTRPSTRWETDGNTRALWHCQEDDGIDILDSSGNGSHAFMVVGDGVPVRSTWSPFP